MLIKKEIKTPTEIAKIYPTIVEIWQEVFTPIIGAQDVAYMLANYQSEAVILAEIHAGAHYFSLILDEQIVGYTAYEIHPDYLYISKLYLLEKYRGKGLMREIFSWYDQLSHELGRKQKLKVNQDNQRAIAVYEHLGFKLVEKQTNEIGDGVLMQDAIYEK